jgi:hypothetical protein
LGIVAKVDPEMIYEMNLSGLIDASEQRELCIGGSAANESAA